ATMSRRFAPENSTLPRYRHWLQGKRQMASIHKEIPIEARPEEVWAAVRDFSAVHKRLALGFVVDAHLDGDARIVTFANGTVARELLVDCDDTRRRLVYAVVSERVKQHSASGSSAPRRRSADAVAVDRRSIAERDRAIHRGPNGSGGARDAESAAEPTAALIHH